ncbi:hypothetical protein PDE_04116 [Penicillium oxalicum 114-2]|uniref:Uncharacterized protein n=1 Tax=Penicillium oxalicum (strain 114-2 / CGMCC 5302) TaxID=933388 RepID=S8B3Q7_PENO1|nr:hypothetical protein PDE_04116 [Penicillium oxalicum 114-2]
MSKKEKRKAKKNASTESEAPEPENVDSSRPSAVAILPEEIDAEQPASLDKHVRDLPTESALPTGPTHERDSTRDVEPEHALSAEISEGQHPASEQQREIASGQILVDEQKVEKVDHEPESSLPRKASKKKAKKAKQASKDVNAQSSGDGQPVNALTEQSASDAGPGLASEINATIATPESGKKPDDEDWPAIEWEEGHKHEDEPSHERIPEPEIVASMPESEIIEEFDESAIPSALQEARSETQPGSIKSQSEGLSTSHSKTGEQRAKSRRKSDQSVAAGLEDQLPDNDPSPVQEVSNSGAQGLPPTPEHPEIETEAPIRTTTPGGSKIASLFPELERGGFRRSALDKDHLSPKDEARDETLQNLQTGRDLATSVSEAPQAKDDVSQSLVLDPKPISQSEMKAPSTTVLTDNAKENTQESTLFPETVALQDRDISMEPSPMPSTETPNTPSLRHLLPSQMDQGQESPCELRRTPSVIRGRHQQTPRMWNLEEQTSPAASSSPPRSLFGPHEEAHVRPRTPLHPIAEQPGDGHSPSMGRGGTPRLEMKPEHVLPRPHTPVRKFTDNAIARETWPTPEKERLGPSQSLDDLLKATQSGGEPGAALTQTPEQGMPVLKPSSSKGKLRRTNRSTSSDLRGASKALGSSQPSPSLDLDQLPSSSSYDPVTDKGKRPLRNMSDVYVSHFLF